MIAGYDEMYLDDAMKSMAESIDYAVNSCHMNADDYMELFIASGLAESFEKGNPKYISGMSGTEIVLEVLEKTGLQKEGVAAQTDYDCSPEYWCGWILAFYQWKKRIFFSDICERISCDRLIQLYPTLHEASEEKAVDTIDIIVERHNKPTKLQMQRKICGLSQKELAEKSGVNIRTLQQYEAGAKNINKASVDSVMALSNVLGCKIEDILGR